MVGADEESKIVERPLAPPALWRGRLWLIAFGLSALVHAGAIAALVKGEPAQVLDAGEQEIPVEIVIDVAAPAPAPTLADTAEPQKPAAAAVEQTETAPTPDAEPQPVEEAAASPDVPAPLPPPQPAAQPPIAPATAENVPPQVENPPPAETAPTEPDRPAAAEPAPQLAEQEAIAEPEPAAPPPAPAPRQASTPLPVNSRTDREQRQREEAAAKQREKAADERREEIAAEQRAEARAAAEEKAKARAAAEAKAEARAVAQRMQRQKVAALERPAQAPASPAATPSGADIAAYRNEVMSRLAAFKQYPESARARGAAGRAVVNFTIEANGRVGSVGLAHSSGVAELDAEVIAMVRRASPFPQPPRGAPHSFSAPVNFRLE